MLDKLTEPMSYLRCQNIYVSGITRFGKLLHVTCACSPFFRDNFGTNCEHFLQTPVKQQVDRCLSEIRDKVGWRLT